MLFHACYSVQINKPNTDLEMLYVCVRLRLRVTEKVSCFKRNKSMVGGKEGNVSTTQKSSMKSTERVREREGGREGDAFVVSRIPYLYQMTLYGSLPMPV